MEQNSQLFWLEVAMSGQFIVFATLANNEMITISFFVYLSCRKVALKLKTQNSSGEIQSSL